MPTRSESRPLESWMDLTLASLDRGVLTLDDERRVVYVNRRAEEMLGRSADDLLGREICGVLGARDDRWLDPDGEDRLGEPDAERALRVDVGGRELTLRSSPVDM